MEYLIGGFVAINIAATLVRILLGTFFVLARFRFFYDPSQPKYRVFCPARLESLTRKMAHCGLKKYPFQWAVAVAVIEVLAGVALIFGFLSTLAAVGLLAILVYATRCTCKEKVERQNPVDNIDRLCCYLWTPEPLYILLALLVLLIGPGVFSVDYLIWG